MKLDLGEPVYLYGPRASLGARFRVNLSFSLWDSLSANLTASLRDSLRASLRASLEEDL